MQTAGFISVFAGFLFAALSAGGNHPALSELTASAGLHQDMHLGWKEVMSLVLMMAGGILLLISHGKEKEESSLQKS